jgi:hypothetical protein
MDEGLCGEAEVIVKQARQDAIATKSLLVRLARAHLCQGNHDAALQKYELAVDVERRGELVPGGHTVSNPDVAPLC